jgi:hypothetical protein
MTIDFRTKLEGGIKVVTASVTIITTIVAFVKLFQSDPGIVTSVIVLSLGSLSVIGCAYLGFSRDLTQLGYVPRFPRWRRLALVGLAIAPTITACALVVPRIWPASWNVVLVADFDGPDAKNYRVTEAILHELQTTFLKDGRIKALGRAITEQEGSVVARASAARMDARICIWGWYARTAQRVQVTYHVEFEKERINQGGSLSGTFVTDAGTLDAFVLQRRIAQRLADEVERKVGLETHTFLRLDEVIGRTEEDLDGRKESLISEQTALGSFVADSFRSNLEADVALVSSSEIRVGRIIPAGPITRHTLLDIFPFGNVVVKVRILGSELEHLIESDLAKRQFLQVSGVKATFDARQISGERLLNLRINGVPFDPANFYTLASTEFFAEVHLNRGSGIEYLVGPAEAAVDTRILRTALGRTPRIIHDADSRITVAQLQPSGK